MIGKENCTLSICKQSESKIEMHYKNGRFKVKATSILLIASLIFYDFTALFAFSGINGVKEYQFSQQIIDTSQSLTKCVERTVWWTSAFITSLVWCAVTVILMYGILKKSYRVSFPLILACKTFFKVFLLSYNG